ncbi:hypothetical protein ABIC86_005717 [Paenibacillus sp. DS2363]|nr:hypothetical protein [Paenibacillus xylanexedens]
MEKKIMKRLNRLYNQFQMGYFTSSNCIVYMIYSISGQKNTRNKVLQAKQISFERNLKKELAKLVRKCYDIKVAEEKNAR